VFGIRLDMWATTDIVDQDLYRLILYCHKFATPNKLVNGAEEYTLRQPQLNSPSVISKRTLQARNGVKRERRCI